jgi:hypothetical protein
MKERYENLKRLHSAEGELNYLLAVYGDFLAKREKYKDVGLSGIEAIHYYLVHKFSWMPKDVKSMSYEDIRFVLSEEMNGWVAPKDAR